MKRRYVFLLLLTLLATSLSAQPYCAVRTFNIRDGLAANAISSMAQGDDGLLWVSTWNGLCCYDGYQFTTFQGGSRGSDDVLSTNRISMIKADDCHHVWLRTYDATLYYYDTRECRFVNVSNIISARYPQKFLPRNIYTLPNGHTWVTEDNRNLNLRIDNQHPSDIDKMEVWGGAGNKLLGSFIRKVEVDSAGREWIFTDQGIMLHGTTFTVNGVFEHIAQVGQLTFFATVDGKLYSMTSPNLPARTTSPSPSEGGGQGSSPSGRLGEVPLPASVTAINDLLCYDAHRLLIATNDGLLAYHTAARSFAFVHHTPCSDLFVDHRHRIWYYTDAAGIGMTDIDGSENRWLVSEKTAISTTSRKVLWVEDGEGTVWTIPRDGAFSYYDERTGQLVPYELQLSGFGYVSLPTIDRFMQDRQGNLWVSSTHDLSLLNFKYRHFRHVPLQHHRDTRSLFLPGNGQLWAGSVDGYIGVYDSLGTQQGWLNQQGQVVPAMVKFSDHVYAMQRDSKGRIWICTKGMGLYLMEPQGAIRHFRHDAADSYSLSSDDVYAVDEDERGNIWVGTFFRGLNLVSEEDGTLRFLNCDNELTRYPIIGYDKVRRITHDGKGSVIVSCNTGIVTFSNRFNRPQEIKFYSSSYDAKDMTSLRTSDVMQTLITRSGDVYVTTMGGGIQQLVSPTLLRNNLQFRSVDVLNAERGNVMSMTEDLDGNLWLVRESVVNRYSPRDSTLTQYGPNDLGSRMEFTEGSPAVDAQTGRIWLATVGGMVTFQPHHVRKSDYQPSIIFTRVQYQGEDSAQPILGNHTLRLTPRQRSLTISFAALDYQDNYLMQYAYRLVGESDDWNYIGTHPQVSFSSLSPGRYMLEVKSTNCDGVWTDNATRLVIDVTPTFWERTWVRIAALLLVIALTIRAVMAYQRHRQTSREREQRLESLLHQYRELQASITHHPTQPRPLPRGGDGGGYRPYTLSEPEITDPDEEMMNRLMQFIEQHVSDETLRVEDMADAVGLGRTVFYGRLKNIVGVSPSDFLRQVRMQRAGELVLRSKLSLSEIAYAVGFSDPKYFAKCFKKDTGVTPSEYRKQAATQQAARISWSFPR